MFNNLDFSDNIKINQSINYLKICLQELSHPSFSEKIDNFVQKYLDDLIFRENIQFLSDISTLSIQKALTNSQKIIEVIRLKNINHMISNINNASQLENQSTIDS